MYTSYPITAPLAVDAVGTNNIQDGAVTNPKIADTAVDAGKLASNAVTREKIINEAINADKIDSAASNAIKTKIAHLTPVNDNGTDLGNGAARVRTAFIGTSIENAGNLNIDLTGATTRTLMLRNTTTGQVANFELDGQLFITDGTAYSLAFAHDPGSPLTASRAAYFPDASGRVILDSDIRASRIRIPLVPYASVDIASPATQTIGVFDFNPSEYAVPGKTTVLTFKGLGGTSAGTATLSLYNLTADAEVASITLTGTLTSFDHDTDTVTLPGSTTYYAVRANVGTDGEYFIGGAYLDITWTS